MPTPEPSVPAWPEASKTPKRLKRKVRVDGLLLAEYIAKITPYVGPHRAVEIAGLIFGHGGDCILIGPDGEQYGFDYERGFED